MDTDLLLPQARTGQIGREDTEASLRTSMADGALSHGWIISAPRGAGKATLAYRIARGLLDPKALDNDRSFDVAATSQTFKLIAAGAHPDLFVAQREWNEKTSKYASEITVETIRKLILFLNRTAAFGGYRVAIIDSADDLNRNAANALLKVLEEPPKKALLLLLSAAPGRLIATIRSRCRRLDLRPIDDKAIAAWLVQEGAASPQEAHTIAANAGGRPGFALTLAVGEGGEAITLAHAFLQHISEGADISKITRALTGKGDGEKWDIFRDVVIDSLSQTVRALARGEAPPDVFAGKDTAALLTAWERLSTLSSRGDLLNLDRAQLIAAMAHDLRASVTAA
jgi:DNA polymerase III subunit delta'